MDEDFSKERYKKLGFRPQKENVYNQFLPYAKKLDDESSQLFADIKTNLVKSVLAREMIPGCALWTSRLNKNIPVSLKYSKSASSKIRPWIAKMRLTDLNRSCDHALKYLRWDVLKKSTRRTSFQPVLFFKAWRVFDYLQPRYIKIYGMKFSKEDHISLIKLFYELITIPDLEPTRINKCASTLTQLLRKNYLLSRDDLQLEWRPLYNLCVRIMEKSKIDIGMYRCFSTLENTIINMVRLARIYFPASATQEILDQFRPYLCPLSGTDITTGIDYLEIFLPVCVKPEEADISYKLWFEEIMNLWNTCHNASAWEDSVTWLMARLASFTMGHIDWEPYIPLMFARFSRSFQLPVAYRQKQTGKQFKIDITAISVWITTVLNGDKNSAFFHLEKFMQALESYYYSANTGRWNIKLRDLLCKLSYCFVQRAYCERYRKRTWQNEIPEDFKLTEADIDRFVNLMKPCVEKAIFSRQNVQEISLTLQYLSSLRPNIIIPITLEKLYFSMDSLTEPHKLISSMMSVTAVARYMVQGRRSNYPEGFTHVVPLLMAVLPGIDSNDIRKCLVTFNFIVHFVNMIPLINSSQANKYYDDLTEEEHIVCEASDGFEDFALQFFDKLCLWVESSSLDFVRLEQITNANSTKNRTEVIAESALSAVISAVLYQCSPEIFTAALRKVYNFVIDKIFEIQISGKMVAIICQGFAKVNPRETLKLFIPYLCDTIERLLEENPNIQNEEHMDAELLYNLQILAEIVEARSELLQYSERLMNVLDKTLHVVCLKANQLAARMLEIMMSSLTYIVPREYRSSSTPYNTHIKDFLSIRDWGKPENMRNLKISWYVPGENEIALVKELLVKYLVPEISKLDKFADGQIILPKEELRRSLRIIISLLSAHPVFPIWEEPAIQLVDSTLDPYAFNLIVNDAHEVTMPDGANVRKVVADTMHRVQNKILQVDEGDTKSIYNIVHIYNILLFNKSRVQDFEYHWKSFHMVKKLLEDRLHQNKQHLRHMLINRIILQQEFRIESRSCSFTETHRQIMLDLFDLSVSRYSEVRITAQSKLFSVVAYFPYSYLVLKPKLIEVLKLNSEENHEKFKGCLYILTHPKNAPIVARHDWTFIRDIWPLVIKSEPSEKPSIVNLVNNVLESINSHFPTIAIKVNFTEKCFDAASILALNVPKCDLSDSHDQIRDGEKLLDLKCEQRILAYNETVDALLDACISGNLHWRYQSMAISFLKNLVHYDVKYNIKAVRYFLSLLIHESLTIRKVALKVTVYILIQNKPKFKKVPIDPYSFSNDHVVSHEVSKIEPGIRSDNKWLLYNSKTVPTCSSDWEQLRYVHDNHTGFYVWPKKVEVYAPPSDQPSIDKRFNELTPEERVIFNFFSDADNLTQFMKYFSMEEKKGKDQFNPYKFLVFKNLFKIFEDKLLDQVVPHIERLVSEKNESSQRFASEMLSGLIRGSKHWNFQKTAKLWEILIPMLQKAIVNMCSEAVTDWGLAMAMALESRDPNRHHWLLEHLIDDPLKDQTSFVACTRLHMLHAALNQQTWRNVELAQRLLEYFKPHLSHSFQNIRDKISGCLSMIFSSNLLLSLSGKKSDGFTPSVETFFAEVMPPLNDLYSYTLNKLNDNKLDNTEEIAKFKYLMDSEDEREKSTRLFKLVAKYVTSCTVRLNYSTLPEYFALLPLVCILQNNNDTRDDEIAPVCTNLLAVLAYTITIKDHMPVALEQMKAVCRCPFWSARAVITEFMPVFVFHNMSVIISKEEWVAEIRTMVLQLLEDPQPEVRISASQVLSGLLHCNFLPNKEELLDIFKSKSKTKLKRKATSVTQQQQQEQKPNHNNPLLNNTLRLRHAGVLGMCAFINSCPYDVPDFLPDIFGQLGSHLNDPQPIPATIRKALGDFKRTHHENWEMHKLKFTEEELSVLSDLTVPPSYYV